MLCVGFEACLPKSLLLTTLLLPTTPNAQKIPNLGPFPCLDAIPGLVFRCVFVGCWVQCSVFQIWPTMAQKRVCQKGRMYWEMVVVPPTYTTDTCISRLFWYLPIDLSSAVVGTWLAFVRQVSIQFSFDLHGHNLEQNLASRCSQER